MKIEQVDFFYLAMPEVTDAADGSQDALLVRVAGGGQVGWGECEASPLVSIAAFVCPMSHGACRPVGASVLGAALDGPADIARIAARVGYNSMDLLQASHTFSGVEMALWDLLGQVRGEPVWRLLGQAASHPKLPYASQLFGATPHDTFVAATKARRDGYGAAKFGWGPIGRGTADEDADHFVAAREGLGSDALLMVDAGQIWGDDVEAAAARLPALAEARATWLEEPFHGGALAAYGALAARSRISLAGGEASHNEHMARHLIDHGRIRFIQIDAGRVGGIGPARRVAQYATARGVTFVNHTFTSQLALSASLQPYADMADHYLCEFPFASQPVAQAITRTVLPRDDHGMVIAPSAPGLGVQIDTDAVSRFNVDVRIEVGQRTLFVSGSHISADKHLASSKSQHWK